MTNRFGLALALIGVITLIVYTISASNRQGDPQVLLVGACLCSIGLLLRRRAARLEKRHAQRFRLLRRNSDIEFDE